MSHIISEDIYSCRYFNWCFILYDGNAFYDGGTSSISKFNFNANCGFDRLKDAVTKNNSSYYDVQIRKVDDSHCILFTQKEDAIETQLHLYEKELAPEYNFKHITNMTYILDLALIEEMPSYHYTRFKVNKAV